MPPPLLDTISATTSTMALFTHALMPVMAHTLAALPRQNSADITACV